MRSSKRRSLWQSVILGGLLPIWIGLSWLLVVSRLDPETMLRTTFDGYSRPDAFTALNKVMAYFWLVHSCLSLTAVSANRSRRTDFLVTLMLGPVITIGLGALSQRWSDPNWVVFVGVCLMGWLASTLVGLVYWGVMPVRMPAL